MTSKKALGKTVDDLFSEDSEHWSDLNGLSSSLIVKTGASEEISPKSEVKTRESEVLAQESEATDLGFKTEASEELSPKSEVKTKESEVLTSESEETDLGVKTEASEEISPKSEIKTKESEVLTSESEETDLRIKIEASKELSPKSEVKTRESEVLTSESEETDLGIKTEVSEGLSPKSEVKTKESGILNVEPEIESSTISIRSPESKAGSKRRRGAKSRARSKNEHPQITGIDLDLMESVAEEARTKARIGTYSTISLAILKYMKKTVPEYSISDDARLLLEEGVAMKYPKLTKNLSLEKGTPRSEIRDLDGRDYDKEIVMRVAAEARDNPKITVWSPYAYTVFKYLRKTVPEFSISMEARVLLEEAVARKYPNLFEEINMALESI